MAAPIIDHIVLNYFCNHFRYSSHWVLYVLILSVSSCATWAPVSLIMRAASIAAWGADKTVPFVVHWSLRFFFVKNSFNEDDETFVGAYLTRRYITQT